MTTLLGLVLLAAPALAAEDAAHRADRLAVRRLNTRSPNGYPPSRRAAAGESERAYARARAEYRRRLDDWRRRAAACEAGDDDACR